MILYALDMPHIYIWSFDTKSSWKILGASTCRFSMRNKEHITPHSIYVFNILKNYCHQHGVDAWWNQLSSINLVQVITAKHTGITPYQVRRLDSEKTK